MTTVISTVALSITLLGFNTFGVEWTAWAMVLYTVIFITLILMPLFGFHLSPGASVIDQGSAMQLRFVVNKYCLYSALGVLITWSLLQNKYDFEVQNPKRVIREMAEEVLFVKIIIVMIFQCILFDLFRVLTLFLKALLREFFV